MKPIGLTMKRGRNKHQREGRGELMLIHESAECRRLSINRIAADDDVETVISVFQESLTHNHELHTICMQYGIVPLSAEDREIVYTQLYGQYVEVPVINS